MTLSNTEKKKKNVIRNRWSFLKRDDKGSAKVFDISIKGLAAKYGTPLIVIAEDEIRKQLQRIKKAFPYERLSIQYACKCNSNLNILKIIKEEGCEIDASSVGEIALSLLAGFSPYQVTLTNIFKTHDDIAFGAKVGVRAITADSLEEINKMIETGKSVGIQIPAFIRINPMIAFDGYSTEDKQFGIPYSQARHAIDIALSSPFIQVKGLHFHGGYINDPKVYFLAAKKLIDLAVYCKEKGVIIDNLDLGGGFPVSYGDKRVFQPEDMGEEFSGYLRDELDKAGLSYPKLIFEPGKFIVANSGFAITKILAKKELKGKNIAILDGSAYSIAPDILVNGCEYDVIPTDLKSPENKKTTYKLTGCTCDMIDIIRKDIELPKLSEGDLLMLMDIGAYSTVLASNFNTLKRPQVILANSYGELKTIRRRDRFSEMFAPELDVSKVSEPKTLKKIYDLMRNKKDKLWDQAINTRRG